MTRPRAKQAGPPSQSPVFMSVPRWALDRVGRQPTHRVVLFALCAYRSKGAGIAFPSIASLADLTGLSRRAIGAALSSLVECEAIGLARPWTQHMPNVYAIPDREPARQTRNQYASEGKAETAPDAHLTHARGAAPAPELTTELTTGTALTATTPRSARAVAVQDCIAIGSSVVDIGIYTNRRHARQRKADPRSLGAVAGDIMARLGGGAA